MRNIINKVILFIFGIIVLILLIKSQPNLERFLTSEPVDETDENENSTPSAQVDDATADDTTPTPSAQVDEDTEGDITSVPSAQVGSNFAPSAQVGGNFAPSAQVGGNSTPSSQISGVEEAGINDNYAPSTTNASVDVNSQGDDYSSAPAPQYPQDVSTTNDSTTCRASMSALDMSSIAEEIIKLYAELLKRQPTSKELADNSSKIKQGTLTFEGLRRKLVDTDEYTRYSKLQSNELNPELMKMVSDREIITYVASLYKDELDTVIPKKIILAMRDIYIYLDYNDYAFRAMLRDFKYENFEQELMTTLNLNKASLIATFLNYFNTKELINMGINIFGSDPNVACTMSNNGGVVSSQSNGNNLFNKDAVAQQAFNDNDSKKVVPFGDHVPYSMTQTSVSLELPIKDITTTSDGKKRIPIHKHDMVLIPELAWSVPQEFPPVCTTLGQPPLVQPVFTDSSLLRGTPLGDAKNTGNGSIMPKFEYKEYITIPN